MPIDKKKLVSLPPKERLKKLKEIENERKKEGNEIEKLIMESIHEINTEKIASEITPQPKAVDITSLFLAENEESIEAKALERGVIPERKEYFSHEQTYSDYSALNKLYGLVSSGGMLTTEQRADVGKIGERIVVAEKYITEGDKTSNLLNASRAVFYKLKKQTGID